MVSVVNLGLFLSVEFALPLATLDRNPARSLTFPLVDSSSLV